MDREKMDKVTDDNTQQGFSKTGQIKVSQDPSEGLKKLAEDEKEYGVDDLVRDSDEGDEDGSDAR